MFFLIDKPIGITSFDVIRKLRTILNVRKIGHAGTLDPLASGCLLIATENSTKLLHLINESKKEYIFTVQIDGKSESLDKGTEIIPLSMNGYKERSKEELENFLLNQETQIPPKYSALHIGGKRAYDLVREGIDFSLKERNIRVHEVEVLYMKEAEICIRIIISSGGYVRSFAPIIGEFFGISGGGYISKLRRTKIITEYGVLGINMATGLDNTTIIHYSQLFHTIPTYKINEIESKQISLGKALNLEKMDYSGLLFLEWNNSITSIGNVEKGIYTILRNNI